MERTTLLNAIGGVLAAAAAPAAELVVIESHVGARPEVAERELRTVVEALGDRALHGQPLGDALSLQLSQPMGEMVAAGEAADILRAIDLAHREYAAGEFDGAITRLVQILDRLEKARASLTHDVALRRVLSRARLLLGDLYRRIGRSAEATALMADAIRADPRSEPSQMMFNPDLIAFFRSVQRELRLQARGSLEIATRPSGMMVYLNDEFVGMSPIHVGDLYPGRHHVRVQGQQAAGRIHEVLVRRDERLEIDAEFDAALRTHPWVGLWFPTETIRQRWETDYAVRIGSVMRARTVVVVSSGVYRDRPALIGSLIDVNSARSTRAAIVAREPAPSQETIRALGTFLAGGDAAPGVIVAGSESIEPSAPSSSWRWTAAATALLVATGAAMVATDCSGKAARTGTCIERRGTQTPGLVLLGLGGAAGVATGVLFYYERSERKASASLTVEF